MPIQIIQLPAVISFYHNHIPSPLSQIHKKPPGPSTQPTPATNTIFEPRLIKSQRSERQQSREFRSTIVSKHIQKLRFKQLSTSTAERPGLQKFTVDVDMSHLSIDKGPSKRPAVASDTCARGLTASCVDDRQPEGDEKIEPFISINIRNRKGKKSRKEYVFEI